MSQSHYPSSSRYRDRYKETRRPSGWYLKIYSPIRAGTINGQGDFVSDRALLKAERASYAPPKESEGVTQNPIATLFISRLSPLTTEATLEEEFRKYGKVVYIKIIRNLGIPYFT